MKPEKSYMICAMERSGSNLLCEALRLTNVAGSPNEYFNYGLESKFRKSFGTEDLSFEGYLDDVIRRRSTKNGVFGFKMMFHHIRPFVKKLREIGDLPDQSVTEVLEAFFPDMSYIQTVRRNRVRQAISYVKARQTQAWTSMERPAEDAELYYDYASIEEYVKKFANDQQKWTTFFEENNIQNPLTVVYEEFSKNYEVATFDVLRYLGIEPPAQVDYGKRKLEKQADQLSEEWHLRFRLERGEISQERFDELMTKMANE